MTIKRLEKIRDELLNMDTQKFDEDKDGKYTYSIDNCHYNVLNQIEYIVNEMKRLNITRL